MNSVLMRHVLNFTKQKKYDNYSGTNIVHWKYQYVLAK